MKQNTLAGVAVFEGVGIHTGKPCRVEVKPAAESSGRVFVTLEGTRIPARVDFVTRCDRSTVLGKDDALVHTPEHLLSAMAAAEIDNAEIVLSGPEIPILDGSAATFYAGLLEAGLKEQPADARVLKPEKPYVVHGDNEQSVLVIPAGELCWEYVLYYPHPMLGCQTCSFRPGQGDYASEIAPSRTFALWEEVKPLLERGMAQGGSLENALVVYQDRYSTPLKVENEPVRHKCLDLIGDFALLDARLQARVLAVKAGHRLHVEAAKGLWEDMNCVECA